MRHWACWALSLLSATVSAQTPGPATFDVFEKGPRIGTLTTLVSRTEDGWRVQGTMETTGSVPVTVPNFEFLYDTGWSGRFMTLDMKKPDDVVIHVAVTGAVTRTDVVRPTEARFRSNSVSPNTIFAPERVYGAYEAVAVRLSRAGATADLPLLVAPIGETRAVVESAAATRLPAKTGSVAATHYILTEIRDRPTRVDLWVANGRMLRLEVPSLGIVVARTDLAR